MGLVNYKMFLKVVNSCSYHKWSKEMIEFTSINTYKNEESISNHPLFVQLLDVLYQFNQTSPYFVLVYCSSLGDEIPMNLYASLQTKLLQLQQGKKGSRLVYRKENWHLIFTFYSKDNVVEENYALKNKV